MLALFGAYLGNTFRHNSSSMLRKLVHVARLATCWVSVKAEQESKKVVGKKTQGFEPFETQAFHKASKNGVSSFVVRVDTVAGTNENAKAPEVKWKITPEQKERIAGLRHGANFKHFFESCPVKDNTCTSSVTKTWTSTTLLQKNSTSECLSLQHKREHRVLS